MAGIGAGVMALPLEVFEDRNVLAAQAGGGSAALSSQATGRDRSLWNVPTPASKTGGQHKRKQPEVTCAPQSLAGDVMLLRSHQPSTSQLPLAYPASAAKHSIGRSEERGLPDDLLSPPSPRSMQILGKSRGLKRDQLDSSQPTRPAKRPALAPYSACRPASRKGKAAVPGLAVSPPQTAQPVGSNWWSQGSAAQPVLDPSQLAPATQADMALNHSCAGHPSTSGAQYMQLSGRRDSASWQPGYPSSPPVPYGPYTRGNKHVPNDPVWAPSCEQESAGAWHSSPPVSRRSTVPAKQAIRQPPQQRVAERSSTGANQQPQTVRYKGRSQDMQMQDLVNEVLAHDTPACWAKGSTREQHSRADGPSRIQDMHSPTLRAGGQGPGQRAQTHPQPEHSWPAPDGGRYILASTPVSKMQQRKTRATQDEKPKDQHLGQHHSARGGLENGHAAPAGYPQALQGGLQQLHTEVERFATMAAPTVAEIRAVQQAQAIIMETALGIWPACTVGSFGSQANATALPGSDIDVTILGVMDVDGATGIKRHQRDAVKAELQKLLKALRKRGALVGKPLLIAARVPIIKCALAVPGGHIPADISLGVANGLSAVALVEQQARALGPSLKALAVVLKALLQQAGLNERVAGGLGSYCLLNLVMAHLLSQGMDAQSQYNLGHLLLSFLDCFGNTFDYRADAVSVRAGGIVRKERQFKQKGKPMLLTIEDPQQPGTDIGSGAFNIGQAVKTMSKAHTKLRHEAEQWGAGAGRAGQAIGWAAVQAEAQDASVAPGTNAGFPLLSSIMDPGLTLERTTQAAQARARAAKHSMEKAVKSTPKAPKKRKLRDAPTHLRFEDDWSDVEDRASRKRRKRQGAYKAGKGQATPAKTAKKLAVKKQSPQQSTKKQAKRKSYFLKALNKKGASHKAQHRK